jgi:hypothetical protein
VTSAFASLARPADHARETELDSAVVFRDRSLDPLTPSTEAAAYRVLMRRQAILWRHSPFPPSARTPRLA